MRRTEQVAAPARTVEQKVAEADAVIAADKRGDAVEPDALRRAQLYAGTSEYRAHKMTFVDFQRAGPAAPRRQQGAA